MQVPLSVGAPLPQFSRAVHSCVASFSHALHSSVRKFPRALRPRPHVYGYFLDCEWSLFSQSRLSSAGPLGFLFFAVSLASLRVTILRDCLQSRYFWKTEIFDRLKNLTEHFVHTELFIIIFLSVFTDLVRIFYHLQSMRRALL